MNLNHLEIPADGNPRAIRDCSINLGKVAVHFRDMEERLIAEIEKADCVVGVVAWLTSERIIHALAKKQCVSIIVQKEDFLRPDSNSAVCPDTWKRKLHKLYSLVPKSSRVNFGVPISAMSSCSDDTIEGVRCAGMFDRDSKASPRVHHKFVIFCRSPFRRSPLRESSFSLRKPSVIEIGPGEDFEDFQPVPHEEIEDYEADFGPDLPGIPYAVWTGSFNFTKNATQSLENAVVIRDRRIATAFLNEWAQITCLSERLDWSRSYVCPEWRIGT